MKRNKLATILFLILSLHATGLVTGVPVLNVKTKAKRGPREDLNETGIFLYPHPHDNDQKGLCKNCSERALSDSTYRYEQQLQCIVQTFERYKDEHMSPYCNVGNDIGCGQPPQAVNNSHWVCDTGYSIIVHTVYSTCQLECNNTGKIMKEIYCTEGLQWYVDNDNTMANACREPRLDKDEGPLLDKDEEPRLDKDEGKKEIWTVVIVVSILCAVIVLLACILLAVWVYCKNRKCSRNLPNASNDSKRETENEIPLQNFRSSIGTCSLNIGNEEDNESSRLLTTELDNQNSEAGNRLPESGDSGLGNEGQESGSPSGSNKLGTSDKSVGTDGSSNKEDNKGKEDGEELCRLLTTELDNQNSEAGNQLPESGDSGLGNEGQDSGSPSGFNKLGTSDKEDNKDQPFVRVFVPNSRTSESGINNIRLQENSYSAPKGSDVYFVASRCNVRFTSIKKKGDEEELEGRLYDESISNMYVLKDIDHADAGIYIFTMVQGVGNTEEEFTDVIELFVGEQDAPQSAPVEVVQRDDRVQRSAIRKDNSPNSSSDMTAGQRLITERPPPDGAENEQQISGQVNPLYNGARPKIRGTGINQTNVLVSGQSNKGNQDIPVPGDTFGPIVSNDLNRMQKESKNNLDQFDSPRNISANENNLMSLENNTENSSVLENSDEGRVRGPFAPHLHVDSLDSGKSYTSENNNSRQSNGSAGNSESERQAEYTLSTKPGKASAIEKPLSLKIPSGPPLDFDSMLSSGKDRSENHLVFVDNLNNGNCVGTETNSNGNSLSETSIELPINVLDELKPPLDFSELNSEAEDGTARNLLVVSSNSVPATEQPLAMNHERRVGRRQDPSGQVSEPVVREGMPTSVDETQVKTIYQRGVRGERSEDTTSHRDPSRAQVRPLSSGEVRAERGAVGGTLIGDSGLDSPQLTVRREPAVEVMEPDRVARDVEVSEEAQIIEERRRESYQCKTHLGTISDDVLLQHLSHRANPIQYNGEARSWLGLALFYGYKRHFLKALEYALQSQINTGPMHHLMTNLFVKEGFKVGHIVSYFTRAGSDYPEIVDLLINKCDEHVDCGYCERLRRRTRPERNNI